ncbi:unnamed protein product [Plutella xylostella]|uniref:(diamondback moth) hypothetical protein n=1 Tax=Plutella xylostella TaxID=51655 RepID=A0A8S4FS58_PLUXY|nr:unnamed protein product [Plutella xylostella]
MKTNAICGLYLLLCVAVDIVFGQVASICRPHERFLSCGGCQRSCRHPTPACEAVCRLGCYCPVDLVRNDDGECVALSECPPLSDAVTPDTTEPRPRGTVCPPNEEYHYCSPCNRTCAAPDPVCPAQCARGCFCRGDLVRNESGVCVERRECPERQLKPAPNIIFDLTQQFQTCGCEATCFDQNPSCDQKDCSAGCFCRPGLVRAPGGKCVKLTHCSQAPPLRKLKRRPRWLPRH